MRPEQLPEPILLGYRPRRPWVPPASFTVKGVNVASVSDCLVELILPSEPDWNHMNTALHYDTAREAIDAANRFGASDFEVHATRLWPILFEGKKAAPLGLLLRHFDERASHPVDEQGLESLGFDVVSVSTAGITGPSNRCDYLPFDCSPLSCNGMGAEIPVNQWCLLPTIETAISAAIRFAREEPEPGPYVLVEVLKCAIASP